MGKIKEVTACRLCDSPDLIEVWDLGEQWVVDFLGESEEGFKAPLIVMRCWGCGLAQLKHTVDRDLMYREYFYRSGISETMRAALKETVEGALARLGDDPLTACDIGANDGTLLGFLPAGCKCIAFEPAKNIFPESGDFVIRDYFSADAYPYDPADLADLVFSVAVFYDVDTPRLFITDVADVLHHDGIWICQQNFLGPIMRSYAFDFLSHEHVVLWDLPTFVKAVAEACLEVFDVEELPINGGTYRVYVGHRGRRPITPRVAEALARDGEYTSDEAWKSFKERVERNGEGLRGLLRDIRTTGKVVAVLGASTRGNSLLQVYGLGVADLPYASDRDPNKWGRRMIGTNIPIVSEEEARHRKPDYYLVLPYSYIAQIKARERDFLSRGGRFILPLPKVQVLP